MLSGTFESSSLSGMTVTRRRSISFTNAELSSFCTHAEAMEFSLMTRRKKSDSATPCATFPGIVSPTRMRCSSSHSFTPFATRSAASCRTNFLSLELWEMNATRCSEYASCVVCSVYEADKASILSNLPEVRGSIPANWAMSLLDGLSSQATASSTSNKGSIFTASKRTVGFWRFVGLVFAIERYCLPSYALRQDPCVPPLCLFIACNPTSSWDLALHSYYFRRSAFKLSTNASKRRTDAQQSSLRSRHTIGPRFLAGPHEKEPPRRRSFDG